jgi:hypothetical protein
MNDQKSKKSEMNDLKCKINKRNKEEGTKILVNCE